MPIVIVKCMRGSQWPLSTLVRCRLLIRARIGFDSQRGYCKRGPRTFPSVVIGTKTMSTELSAKIAEQLTNRAGIPSQGYKKSPVVHSGFIASIYHNKLWIWLTAKTKIRITPSKKHGQAVVIVKEGKRNISTVWIARLQIITAYGDSFTTISKRILSGIIDTHVPIGIPVAPPTTPTTIQQFGESTTEATTTSTNESTRKSITRTESTTAIC